ncbi:type VI secretion system tip protein VgrG [Lysobacter soli]|uniref:type VI secretion system Vgr family protein n=1 Tax=Lysobacter soli TaxID=453783 RepID=UPI0012EE9183|nr:type VI secretion system Vgr family protein [Lysobacter soli]QGW65991.1 type VI secretion system tip protein VgrG [Lysobacter soli]
MAWHSGLRFTFEGIEGVTFDVVRFELIEAISQPFRLELHLSSADPNIELDALLDRGCVFAIEREGESVRTVHGVISAFEQTASGFRRTRYKAIVEPPLARLGLWQQSRIHQQAAIPQILRERFKERSIDAAIKLTRTHEVREFCAQFNESDLHFASRIAAEEGITYYFDALNGTKLTFIDAVADGPCLVQGGNETVLYVPTPGGDAIEPRVWHFAVRRQRAPTRVTQRDRTFKNPQYTLEHRSQAGDAVGDYEHYGFPGRYKFDAAGKPFTSSLLSGLRNEATRAEIEGDDARLWPGLRFLLREHPTEAFNRYWRVVSMHHIGEHAPSQEEDGSDAEHGTRYTYRATAVPGDFDWKPTPLPRPTVDGPQIADVVGPPGEVIHTDEHDRIRIWFPWDREGPRERSSCWLRVAQGWAGAGYGAMFTPRAGHEVLVSFVDGDVDQPVVTGCAYSALNRPPYPLPAHKAVSTIKSDEHKGNGYNELLIDDTSGELKAQLRSTHAATQLSMGFITHPRDQQGRGQPRGEGFELRTDESGALRAARGLLLSAYERANAVGSQLDQRELLECVRTLAQLTTSLLDTAAQHQAPAMEHDAREELVLSIERLGAGANDRRNDSGGKPIIALSAPEGIAAATPRSVLLGAGENVESVAQRDTAVTAGARVHVTAGKGIGHFAYEGGITQIAHRDDLSLQAQHGNAYLVAAETVYVRAKNIVIEASERLTTSCAGAYQTMEGGNIETGCPGTYTIKAKVEVTSSASLGHVVNEWKQAQFDERFQAVLPDGTPARNRAYALVRADGARLEGITDDEGGITLQKGLSPEGLTIEWLNATAGEG